MAANNIGSTPGAVRRHMAMDDDFRAEVEDSMELFKDNLRLELLHRAKSSDKVLMFVAQGMIPETFNASKDVVKKGKPSGLKLRDFDKEEAKEPSRQLRLVR